MAAWLTAKAPHWTKGKRVGEVAEQYFKQFEKSLNHKHALAGRHDLRLLFQHMGKRLLEEHDEKRNSNMMTNRTVAGTGLPVIYKTIVRTRLA